LRTDVTAILPLLDHHLRSVRIEAARVLSRVPDDMLPQLATGPQRTALEQATQEFRRGLLAQSERAGAHMGLGMLAENLGDDDEAERQYRTAIRLEPTTSGLRSQLALMLERIAQEDAREAVNLLLGRPADADMPEDVNQLLERRDDEFLSKIAILSPAQMDRYAELYQRVQQRQDEAELLRKVELPLLARDARALPDSGEVQYAYACSLYINGREDEAEKALQTARKLMPYSELPVLMLARFYQKQKKWPEAIQCAQRLLELAPDNPQYDALLTELRRQRGGGAP
jgi:tetratricopeptide (TPR) repeat protein